MEKPTLDVEKLLERLEQTVATLENGDVTARESIELLEEGISLTEQCFAELESRKGKLIKLKQRIEALDE